MTMEISAAINKAKIPDLINGGIEIRPDRNNRNWKADTSSPLRSRKAAADEADHGFEVISGYRSTPKKTLLLISGQSSKNILTHPSSHPTSSNASSENPFSPLTTKNQSLLSKAKKPPSPPLYLFPTTSLIYTIRHYEHKNR